MRRLRRVAGSLLVIIGAGLIVLGEDFGIPSPLTIGIMAIVLGAVLLLTAFVVIERSGTGNPLTEESSSTSLGQKPARSGEMYTGTVKKVRTYNSVRGVYEFGTEMIIDVERDGRIIQGFVRQHLTPVQIACLTPGSSIIVTKAAGDADKYSLVLDTWQEARPGQ